VSEELPEFEYRDVDVVVDVGHLREPFVVDLRGVILSTSESLIGPDAQPRPGVTAEVAFDVLVDRIMELVDELASEIVLTAIEQMTEQMGGEFLSPPLTVDDIVGGEGV
jgi:hypothetical protein